MKLTRNIPIVFLTIICVSFYATIIGCAEPKESENSGESKNLPSEVTPVSRDIPRLNDAQASEAQPSQLSANEKTKKNSSGFRKFLNAVLLLLLIALLVVVIFILCKMYSGKKSYPDLMQPKYRKEPQNSGRPKSSLNPQPSYPPEAAQQRTIPANAIQVDTAQEVFREKAGEIAGDITGKAKKILETLEQHFISNMTFKVEAEFKKLNESHQRLSATVGANNRNAETFQSCIGKFDSYFDLAKQIGDANNKIDELEKEKGELKRQNAEWGEIINKMENPYEAIIPADVVALFGLSSDKLKTTSPALRTAIREWCCFADWARLSPQPAEFKTEFRKIDKALVALRKEPGFDLEAMRSHLKIFIEDTIPSKFNAGIEISWNFKGREFSPDKNYSPSGGTRVVFVISAYYNINIKGIGGEKAEVECD
ncbi:MAG: hypothetical protein FWG50_03480 [Kiritimatiellaeota bacterium]|nr:hypothetical protein [Kiritimatiellota bacterium]